MEPDFLKAALEPGPERLAIEQLGRYADDALDPDERRAAGAHIRECLNCQAELAPLQASTSSAIRPDEADAVRHGVARLEQRKAAIVGVVRKENGLRQTVLVPALMCPRRCECRGPAIRGMA